MQAYLLCFFSSNSALNVLYLQYYMPREESNKQDKKMRISLLVQKRRVLESLFLRHSESLFLPHFGVFVSSTLLHSFWKWTGHITINFRGKETWDCNEWGKKLRWPFPNVSWAKERRGLELLFFSVINWTERKYIRWERKNMDGYKTDIYSFHIHTTLNLIETFLIILSI